MFQYVQYVQHMQSFTLNHLQGRRQGEKTSGDKPSNQSAKNIRSMPPEKVWNLQSLNCHFLHIWEVILQNSEDY